MRQKSHLGEGSLFPPAYPDPTPRELARTTDPATSHKAAHEIITDLPDLYAETIAAVQSHPGSTASELERDAGVLRSRYGRRLSELEKLGLVTRTNARPCTVTNRHAATWLVTHPPAP